MALFIASVCRFILYDRIHLMRMRMLNKRHNTFYVIANIVFILFFIFVWWLFSVWRSLQIFLLCILSYLNLQIAIMNYFICMCYAKFFFFLNALPIRKQCQLQIISHRKYHKSWLIEKKYHHLTILNESSEQLLLMVDCCNRFDWNCHNSRVRHVSMRIMQIDHQFAIRIRFIIVSTA